MHTHNRNREKSSGQATQNYLNHMSQDRTSAQPQANLSLLRNNSLNFQPLNRPWGKVHKYVLWPKGIELFAEDQAFQLSYDLDTTLVPLSCQQVFSLFLSVYLFVAGQAYCSESSGGGGGGAKSYDGDKKPSHL